MLNWIFLILRMELFPKSLSLKRISSSLLWLDLTYLAIKVRILMKTNSNLFILKINEKHWIWKIYFSCWPRDEGNNSTNTMSFTIRAESELSSSIEIDTRGDIWLSSLRILSQNIKFPTKCKQEKKSYLNCANIQRIYEWLTESVLIVC